MSKTKSRVVNIMDFGAKPSDESFDNAPAIRKAIEFASKAEENTDIIFPRGSYTISTPLNNERFIIQETNIKGVSLKGCGSRLYVTNPFAGVFQFISSTDISVEGFEIKYKNAPWTQGSIVEVDTEYGTLVYESEEGYDIFADKRYTDCFRAFGVVIDPDNFKKIKFDTLEHFRFKSVESISDRKYRATLERPELVKNQVIKVGDRIVYTNRTMSASVISMYRTKNITVRDMLVHECGDCLFVAAYIEGDVIINNYRTRFDGRNYAVSSADGVHIQGLRGRLMMEDCYFEGLLDDCVNLYQFPGIVRERLSECELRIRQLDGNVPRKGDTVMFYNPENQVEKLRAKVLDVRDIDMEAREWIVTLDKSCAEINAAAAVPQADTMFIADSMAPGSIIRNNHFRFNRRYGVLLKSRDTVVENNIFEDLGGDAINFTADTSNMKEREGPYAENVIVRNNVIKSVCYMNSRNHRTKWASGACIGIYRHNKEIRLCGNTFVNTTTDTIACL